MNLDIDLINSLKIGEYIKISDNEVIACVSCKDCENCYYHYDNMLCF